MCGLIGVINPSSEPKSILEKLKISQKIISHRGNDAQAIYKDLNNNFFIAFNRLAIVDLDKRSNQPMKYEYQNKSVIGMINGEIYNYKEIKKNLKRNGYVFKTESDTEVFLALFLDKGTSCFDELNGIFSAFIFDYQSKKVFLVRDHIGVKPLYFKFNRNKKELIFASEIKAFKAFVNLKPNIENLSEFLCFGENSEENTIYYGINQLQPGNFLEMSLINNSNIQINQYFTLVDLYNNSLNKLESDYEEFFNERIFTDLIFQQFDINVPMGVQFSGGLDSSFLTSLIMKKKIFQTYSATIPNFEESEEYWQKNN